MAFCNETKNNNSIDDLIRLYKRNLSRDFDTSSLLAVFLKESSSRLDIASMIYDITNILALTAGLPSSIIAIIILLVFREFRKPSFAYILVINISDLFYLFCSLSAVLFNKDMVKKADYWAWFQRNVVSGRLEMISPTWSYLLLIYVSYERATAFNWLARFVNMNNWNHFAKVTTLTFCTSVCLNMPVWFSAEPVQGNFTSDHNYFGLSTFGYRLGFSVYWLFLALLSCVYFCSLIVFTHFTVKGIRDANKRKINFASNQPNTPKWRQEILEYQQLGRLHLCEVLPFIIQTTFMFVMQMWTAVNYLIEETPIVSESDARNNAIKSEIIGYLGLCATVASAFAHSSNLYLYLIFSAKFKNACACRRRQRDQAEQQVQDQPLTELSHT